MNFKTWLENQSTITKIAVFDFDGTLADTPMQPSDWKPTTYVAPDGKERDDTSWWTHPDSLPENFPFNKRILAEFKKAKMEPQTKAVLLTGRSGMRTAHIIRGRFRQEGLYGKRMIAANYNKAIQRHQSWPNSDHPEDTSPYGHEEYFAGDMRTELDYPKTPKGNSVGDTFSHKIYVVEKKLMSNNIQQIDFWDDRDAHLPKFIEFFTKLLTRWPNLNIINIYRVKGDTVETIPLVRKS
jgi:hypothetical protein